MTRVVIVTGANSGVGYALVKRLILENLYTVQYDENAPLPFAQTVRNKAGKLVDYVLSRADVATNSRMHAFFGNLNLMDYLNRLEGIVANTALGLPRLNLECGVVVVMACRNLEKAEAARKNLINECVPTCLSVGYRSIVTMEVDLADPDSVFAFCQDFQRKFERLDVLYANAAYYPVDRLDYGKSLSGLLHHPAEIFETGGKCVLQKVGERSRPNLGLVFASNVLSHFIILSELKELLQRTENSKIIWTASSSAQPHFFTMADFQCVKGDHPYESSKRATDVLSFALNERFKAAAPDSKRKGPVVQSLLASPGNVITNMMHNAISVTLLWAVFVIGRILLGIKANNIDPYNGAESLVRLSKAPYSKSLETAKWHSVTDRLGRVSVEQLPLDDIDTELAADLYAKCDLLYKEFKK